MSSIPSLSASTAAPKCPPSSGANLTNASPALQAAITTACSHIEPPFGRQSAMSAANNRFIWARNFVWRAGNVPERGNDHSPQCPGAGGVEEVVPAPEEGRRRAYDRARVVLARR